MKNINVKVPSNLHLIDAFNKLSVFDNQKKFIFSYEECISLIEDNLGKRQYASILVFFNKTFVGHSLISHNMTCDQELMIDNYFIDKKWQGFGIGTAAFTLIIEKIHDMHKNCSSLGLFVNKDNLSALGLFEKCGFVRKNMSNEYKEDLMRLSVEARIQMQRISRNALVECFPLINSVESLCKEHHLTMP